MQIAAPTLTALSKESEGERTMHCKDLRTNCEETVFSTSVFIFIFYLGNACKLQFCKKIKRKKKHLSQIILLHIFNQELFMIS